MLLNSDDQGEGSQAGSWVYIKYTVFPKKDARFLKIKNMPDLLSGDREAKIIEISTLNV